MRATRRAVRRVFRAERRVARRVRRLVRLACLFLRGMYPSLKIGAKDSWPERGPLSMWKNHKPTENVVVNELREETMVELDEWRLVPI